MIRAERSALAERQAKLEAEANLEYARKGNKILGSVFANLDAKAKYETIAELRNALKANLLDAANQLDDLGGGDPLALAELRSTLGASLQSLGEAKLALPFFQQAFDGRKAHLGADHPDTLASASQLAGGLMRVGSAQEAMPLLEATLMSRTEKLGPDHPDTLSSMNQLASGLHRTAMQDLVVTPDRVGKVDENTIPRVEAKVARALALWEKTLELGKRKLPPDHPVLLSCMYSLASGYSFTPGKGHLAQPLLEDLLALQKKRLGPSHPDTLTTMDFLAGHCGGDREVTLREEAFAATKTRLGLEHPNTRRIMHNLAGAYRHAGKHERALALTEDYLRLLTVKYGPDGLAVIGATLELAGYYLEAKREPEASRLFRDAFDRRRKQSTPMDLADDFTVFSFELLSHQAYPTAEEFLREILAIREKHQPDDWTVFDTQALLGRALLGQKKYAEPQLLKGYEGMKTREKTIPPQAATRIPDALDRLIELYTATNKPDEVKKYQELKAKYSPPPAFKHSPPPAPPPRAVK